MLKSRAPFGSPIHRIPNVAAYNHKTKEHNSQEEPSPASPLLVPSRVERFSTRPLRIFEITHPSRHLGVPNVHIVGCHRNDIMIVRYLACLSAEAKIEG